MAPCRDDRLGGVVVPFGCRVTLTGTHGSTIDQNLAVNERRLSWPVVLRSAGRHAGFLRLRRVPSKRCTHGVGLDYRRRSLPIPHQDCTATDGPPYLLGSRGGRRSYAPHRSVAS